jgi:23S rRNA pseudouridine1911/1915/1917 synthase
MNDVKTYSYECTADDIGLRPDKVLAQRLGLSRTQVQSRLEQGLVCLDGKPLTAKARIHVGSVIELAAPELKQLTLTAKEMPLEILFEDKHLIVLNKAPGVVVHPAAGNWDDTLVSALLFHCRGKLSGINGVERPGIVHRLDKDTSGVLAVAKDDAAHQNLSAQFKDRATEKYYLAYVSPPPTSGIGSWLAPIGRHPHQRQKMMALRDKEAGREARTDFKILKDYQRAALLELRIHTGRTHQIRVHCTFAGCPVIGDTVYGRNIPWVREAGVTRQLLHAQRLILNHPATGKRMEFIAPMPEDFVRFEKFLSADCADGRR